MQPETLFLLRTSPVFVLRIPPFNCSNSFDVRFFIFYYLFLYDYLIHTQEQPVTLFWFIVALKSCHVHLQVETVFLFNTSPDCEPGFGRFDPPPFNSFISKRESLNVFIIVPSNFFISFNFKVKHNFSLSREVCRQFARHVSGLSSQTEKVVSCGTVS